jgi:hypothetical protein
MTDRIISCAQWLPDRDSFMQEQHLRPADRPMVDRLFLEAEQCAGPVGGYLETVPDACKPDSVQLNGTRVRGRLLAGHLSRQALVFPFVATCGQDLSAWVDSKTDLMENYLAFALAEHAANVVVEAVRGDIEAVFGLDSLSRMQPGSLPDWPIDQQKPLFEILGPIPEKIQVRLTSSCLMLPTNSLSGIYFRDPEGFISCRLCSRKCPRRKAPFDPEQLARLENEYSSPSNES